MIIPCKNFIDKAFIYMQRHADNCTNLTGWNKYFLTFLYGVLSALSMPPLCAFPILFFTFPSFIWILSNTQNKKQAFFTGWFFGAGFFIMSLYWVSFALFVDFEQWWWVLPFSSILAPIMIAIYTAIAALIAFVFYNKGANLALSFTITFSITEWLRGHLFTGFPWNLIGYSYMNFLDMAQNLSWLGIYGLSLFTVFWAMTPTFLTTSTTRNTHSKPIKIYALMSILSFFAFWLYGDFRLKNTAESYHDNILIRIVQPNLKQKDKWDRTKQWDNFKDLIQLSRQKTNTDYQNIKHPTHIIWPETSATYPYQRRHEAKTLFDKTLAENSFILTGKLRFVVNEHNKFSAYNSFIVVNHLGDTIKTYDKFHLVPFGEYIPFRNIFNLTPVGSLISNTGDFQTGSGPYISDIEHIPNFSPLICYEAIFPAEVTKEKTRPEWLINTTNDAWYGKSAGPYQHFAITQARAIEEGIPMIRSANTGISAIISPYGRILKRIPLSQQGIIDSPLPFSLPQTIYALYKDMIFILFLIALSSVVFTSIYRRVRKTKTLHTKA